MNFLKDKKLLRFLFISSILIFGAIGSALVAAAATSSGDFEVASLASKIALGLALCILLYVVPRLARNVQLEYLHSRLAMNVMSAGWMFIAFILIVAIASVSTGNNLLYMVLAALMATMIISGVASRLSIGELGVALRFPDHIFAGEPAQLEATISNQKRFLPSFSLVVAATDKENRFALRKPNKIPDQSIGDLAHFAIVPAGAKAKASITRTFEQRGVFPVRGFTITTRFPFGFVERRRYVEANGEVTVYPNPLPLDDFYHLLPLTHGQMESEQKGSGSDLYAIRHYTPTDHPRYVDWKATAKASKLMVREFTRDDDWRVTIALDNLEEIREQGAEDSKKEDAANSEQRASPFEKAVTLAASLLTHFLDEGADVRLMLSDYDSKFGRDNDHRYAMLKQLARITPITAENPEDAPTNLLQRLPALADDEFKILLTSALRGSIPANIWRSSHVVYFDDL